MFVILRKINLVLPILSEGNRQTQHEYWLVYYSSWPGDLSYGLNPPAVIWLPHIQRLTQPLPFSHPAGFCTVIGITYWLRMILGADSKLQSSASANALKTLENALTSKATPQGGTSSVLRQHAAPSLKRQHSCGECNGEQHAHWWPQWLCHTVTSQLSVSRL